MEKSLAPSVEGGANPEAALRKLMNKAEKRRIRKLCSGKSSCWTDCNHPSDCFESTYEKRQEKERAKERAKAFKRMEEEADENEQREKDGEAS